MRVFACNHCQAEFTRRDKEKSGREAKYHFCSDRCKRDAKRPGGCMYLANGGFGPEKFQELTDEQAKLRTKRCTVCNIEFIDRSKRGVKRVCSRVCKDAKMVSTRKSRGSYQRTDEQNQKLSNTLRQMCADGVWIANTPEHRQKLSLSMQQRWASGDMSQKSQATFMQKYGVRHWTQSEHWKHRLNLGGRWHAGFRDDLGQHFRSGWEANYARFLNHLNLTWEYEPRRFQLSNGKTYLPDFLVDGRVWTEIKGWMRPSDLEKLLCFRSDYPQLEFELVDRAKYLAIMVEYADSISTWE